MTPPAPPRRPPTPSGRRPARTGPRTRTRTRTRTTVAAALPASFLLAGALFLTGCQAPPPGTHTLPAVTRTPEAGAELPLTAYSRNSWDALDTGQKALVHLARQCLEEFGFEDPDPGPPIAIGEPWRDSPYRAVPPAQATARGYQQPPSKRPLRSVTVGTRPSAEDQVLLGTGPATYRGRKVPEGGCQGEASRTLRTGLGAFPDPEPSAQAAERALRKADKDARVADAVAGWSTCMSEHGFHYDHPRDPVKAFEEPHSSPTGADEVTRKQKDTAAADGDCNRRTGLERTWLSVVVPLQKVELAKHHEQIERAAEWFDGYRRNARRALAEG
ncbi:hypothetical protein ABT026_15715 [Streptomyces sp. NPDC002734]|uniref:hypothetical protein n=1 Tax=Streptomyces sp. NPDC002734 TaxID=3154426 RepID=UPI00332211C5